jgi:hypothetical protein
MIIKNTAKFIKNEYSLSVPETEIYEFIGSEIENFYRSVVTVKDGVFEFLDHLKKEGISMCVASATDMKYVRVALEVLGLAPYFPIVMSCADINVGKDVPDIYLMARDALGFSEDEIIDDYMTSFIDYYKIEKDTVKYNLIRQNYLDDMMLYAAGRKEGDSLEGIDWKAAVEQISMMRSPARI